MPGDLPLLAMLSASQLSQELAAIQHLTISRFHEKLILFQTSVSRLVRERVAKQHHVLEAVAIQEPQGLEKSSLQIILKTIQITQTQQHPLLFQRVQRLS